MRASSPEAFNLCPTPPKLCLLWGCRQLDIIVGSNIMHNWGLLPLAVVPLAFFLPLTVVLALAGVLTRVWATTNIIHGVLKPSHYCTHHMAHTPGINKLGTLVHVNASALVDVLDVVLAKLRQTGET